MLIREPIHQLIIISSLHHWVESPPYFQLNLCHHHSSAMWSTVGCHKRRVFIDFPNARSAFRHGSSLLPSFFRPGFGQFAGDVTYVLAPCNLIQLSDSCTLWDSYSEDGGSSDTGERMVSLARTCKRKEGWLRRIWTNDIEDTGKNKIK